jgi:DNA-3-methyladenine glycosylase
MKSAQSRLEPLSRDFYAREAEVVARELIGRILVHCTELGSIAGMIVEAEAYGPDDPASHAFRGPTPRNRMMFGAPGFAYVYRSYGIHWCLNAVTGKAGSGQAVLIRSLEPVCGMELMRYNRGFPPVEPRNDRNLCRGPGSLCRALGITGEFDGMDLTDSPLTIAGAPPPELKVVQTTRVGLTKAVDQPWRFISGGNRFVSRPPARRESS